MPLRAAVDDWMGELYLAPWRGYFEEKRGRGELARVGDVWVDVPNVVERPFTCDPTTCSPGLRRRGQESCCAEFLVEITDDEVRNLGRVFDEVSAFLAERDEHWAKKRPSLGDCIAPHADNRFQRALAKRKRRCTFSFLNDEGAISCGIHGWALEAGVDVHKVKPKLCFLFPLLVQDLQDGTWLITVIDEENCDLVGFGSYRQLPCLQGERTFGATGTPFFEDHRGTLAHLFGVRFVRGLDALAAERLGARRDLVPLSKPRTARRKASNRESSRGQR